MRLKLKLSESNRNVGKVEAEDGGQLQRMQVEEDEETNVDSFLCHMRVCISSQYAPACVRCMYLGRRSVWPLVRTGDVVLCCVEGGRESNLDERNKEAMPVSSARFDGMSCA